MDKEKDKSKKDRLFWSRCISFTKKNWIILLLGLVCVGFGIVVVVACAGGRLVFAPELEPNWESVSAAATCASVFFSVLAIIFAISIPREISEQQNKIALYEKRVICYNTLNDIKNFLDEIGKPSNRNIATWQRMYWKIHNLYDKPEFVKAQYSVTDRNLLTKSCLDEDKKTLYTLQFLLPAVQEQTVNDISKKLSDFISSIFENSSGKECGNIVDDELNSQMLELSGLYYNFYNKTMEQLRPLVKLS